MQSSAPSDSSPDDVLATVRATRDLALHEEVRRRWSEPSALADLTVGGLAWHLADQVHHVVTVVGAGPSDEAAVSLAEHYRRAAWVRASHDDESNVSVREGADRRAAAGPDALAEQLADDLDRLPSVLEVPSDAAVLIPWTGYAVTAGDFVTTRLMEMVVHGDDLAVSVDVPLPDYPADVVRAVLGLLTEIAVDRHGTAALVRALSRSERAPDSVAAF